MNKDYYKILEIEKNSSDDEIKKAYRKLAHKYHPDKKDGDEEKFKEINEAYQILSDKSKKSQYDKFGQAPNSMRGANNSSGFYDYDFRQNGFNVNYKDFGRQFNFVSFKKMSPFWWLIIIPLGIAIVIIFGIIILGWLLLRSLIRRK